MGRQSLSYLSLSIILPLLQKNRMSTSSCRVSVVIDCDWENLMDIKDIQKLAKQIQYSYTTNRRLDNPLQFFVTGLKQGSMLKRKLDNDYAGYTNWDVYFKVSQCCLLQLFMKDLCASESHCQGVSKCPSTRAALVGS